MCNFQNLVSSEAGQIQRCSSCKCYHLKYYTTYLALSDSNFEIFEDLLFDKINSYDYITCDQLPAKCINVPTPIPGFGLTLTREEAIELYKLIQQSANELMALQMMDLFKEGSS